MLGSLRGPVLAQQHTATTYTGAPFNFCLPGYDSFDYQECWDFNWTVLNSSMTTLQSSNDAAVAAVAVATTSAATYASSFTAVGASTAALSTRATALEVWQGTASPHIALLNTSTATLALRMSTASVRPEEYGAVGDCVTDDYAAFASAQAALTEGGEILLSPKCYRLSQTFNIVKPIRLRGVSRAMYNEVTIDGPKMEFDLDVQGIVVNRDYTIGNSSATSGTFGTDASGTIIENLIVSSLNDGGNADIHGIRLRATATLRDLTVRGFPGDGVNIVADTAGTPERKGNANGWRLDNVNVTSNGRNGLYVDGTDVNAGLGSNIRSVSNGWWGIWDSSYLGNTYTMPRAATNSTGPFKTDNANARNVFVGAYTESDQNESDLVRPTLVVGGIWEADFSTNTTAGIIGVTNASARANTSMKSSTLEFESSDNSGGDSVSFIAGSYYGTSPQRLMAYALSVSSGDMGDLRMEYIPTEGWWRMSSESSNSKSAYGISTDSDTTRSTPGQFYAPNGVILGGHSWDPTTNHTRVSSDGGQPTTGEWKEGDFVFNDDPSAIVAADNGFTRVTLGWSRIVDGSAHVNGVDWQTVYGGDWDGTVSYAAGDFEVADSLSVSSIAVPTGDLYIQSATGENQFHLDLNGGSVGLRLNPKDWVNGALGTLDLIDTAGPDIFFLRNDTTVTAGDSLGELIWRDRDSSTGGSSEKAKIRVLAAGSWSSGNAMEQEFRFGLSRGGGASADYMVLSSTGLLIGGGAGIGSSVACGTCTLQVVSPAGYGVSVEGHVKTSSLTVTHDGNNTAAIIAEGGSGQTAGLLIQRGNYQTDAYTDYKFNDISGTMWVTAHEGGSSINIFRFDDGLFHVTVPATIDNTLDVSGLATFDAEILVSTINLPNGVEITADEAGGDYPLVFRSPTNMAFIADTNGDDSTSWLWCRNSPTIAGCTTTMELNQSGELYGLVRVLSSNAIFGDGVGTSCSTCTVFIQGDAGSGLSVQRNIETGGQVAVSTPTGGNGNLRVRAGNGNGGGTTPIILYSWSGSSSTANTVGQMVAASYTMPMGTLVNNGDAIEVFAISRATTTSLSKRIEVRIDGDESSTGASTNGARQWKLEGRMVRDSATNGTQYFERQRSDPGGAAGQSVDWDTTNVNTWATEDTVIEILLYGVTGATLAGDEDMTLKHFQVVYWPAP